MRVKPWIFLIAFMIFCSPAALAADDLFDLSKTPWGMNRKDTAKVLGIKLPPTVGKDSGLTVKGFELGGLDGAMGYVFMQDMLVEVHFRIAGLAEKVFSAADAEKMRQRLSRQFDRNYGKRIVDNALCENATDCHYSIWFKDEATAVGIFLVQSPLERNLGVSYMQRPEAGTTDQTHRGLFILPPNESPSFSDFAFKPQ